MALRVSIRHGDYSQSFINLQKMCNRAPPESILKHKLALCLYKLYNKDYNSIESAHLNFNQILTSRQTVFKTSKSNIFKVGINSLSNRLAHLYDEIPLSWLNMSIDTFKIHCKKLYLSSM